MREGGRRSQSKKRRGRTVETVDAESAGFETSAGVVLESCSVKRCLCRLQVYKLVGFHSKGSATSLEAATNQPLRRETAYTCSDTGAVIHRIDKKYVTIRNEKASATHPPIPDSLWSSLPVGLPASLLGSPPPPWKPC